MPDPLLGGLLDPARYDVQVRASPRAASNERASRIRVEEAEAKHRRLKELITLVTFVVGLSAIGVACLIILFVPGMAVEQRQWAFGRPVGHPGRGDGLPRRQAEGRVSAGWPYARASGRCGRWTARGLLCRVRAGWSSMP